jgi:hypothetical protein
MLKKIAFIIFALSILSIVAAHLITFPSGSFMDLAMAALGTYGIIIAAILLLIDLIIS